MRELQNITLFEYIERLVQEADSTASSIMTLDDSDTLSTVDRVEPSSIGVKLASLGDREEHPHFYASEAESDSYVTALNMDEVSEE